ncbi:Molybdopterin synthase sulfur carrier subunit [Trichinella pseudospiralis]
MEADDCWNVGKERFAVQDCNDTTDIRQKLIVQVLFFAQARELTGLRNYSLEVDQPLLQHSVCPIYGADLKARGSGRHTSSKRWLNDHYNTPIPTTTRIALLLFYLAVNWLAGWLAACLHVFGNGLQLWL